MHRADEAPGPQPRQCTQLSCLPHWQGTSSPILRPSQGDASQLEVVSGPARWLPGRRRDSVPRHNPWLGLGQDGGLRTAEDMTRGVGESLRRLGIEYVDIFHVHGLKAEHYDYAVETIVPALQRLRRQGRIRFIGVTEGFSTDPGHRTLTRAVQDDCWDVVMCGFNILNQTARERVLAGTMKRNMGALAMFVVRRALSDPEYLQHLIADLAARGKIDAVDHDDPLGFLIHEEGTLTDAAYRFVRHEPGIHVVLSGTGDMEHLEANAASISGPPLPEADLKRLREIFAQVDDVSGQ